MSNVMMGRGARLARGVAAGTAAGLVLSAGATRGGAAALMARGSAGEGPGLEVDAAHDDRLDRRDGNSRRHCRWCTHHQPVDKSLDRTALQSHPVPEAGRLKNLQFCTLGEWLENAAVGGSSFPEIRPPPP